MTELMKARAVLQDFMEGHQKVHDEYHLRNDEYIDGLRDAVRILDKCISKDIERMAEYYEVKD